MNVLILLLNYLQLMANKQTDDMFYSKHNVAVMFCVTLIILTVKNIHLVITIFFEITYIYHCKLFVFKDVS